MHDLLRALEDFVEARIRYTGAGQGEVKAAEARFGTALIELIDRRIEAATGARP